MTYREQGKIFLQEAANAYSALVKTDEELIKRGDGFIDKIYIDKRAKAYTNWQLAQGQFNAFASMMIYLGVKLDDHLTTTSDY